jgi:hypothetical protein
MQADCSPLPSTLKHELILYIVIMIAANTKYCVNDNFHSRSIFDVKKLNHNNLGGNLRMKIPGRSRVSNPQKPNATDDQRQNLANETELNQQTQLPLCTDKAREDTPADTQIQCERERIGSNDAGFNMPDI